MDIRQVLMEEHSRYQSQKVVDYILAHRESINELMECFFDDDLRLCQRAAWPVGILGQQRPDIILPYLPEMLAFLDHPQHDAVIRNTVRTLQYIDIPENLVGEVYERCFQYLINPKYPAAIKAFSTTVLTNIAMDIPELKEELILAIEEQIPHGTSGFVNRAGKMLRRLRGGR